uniref:Uncharacterized protein n=1 Tax=Anguilla anguilla TaxID=7936 RepID=A0A0E9PMM7_ANGAN
MLACSWSRAVFNLITTRVGPYFIGLRD